MRTICASLAAAALLWGGSGGATADPEPAQPRPPRPLAVLETPAHPWADRDAPRWPGLPVLTVMQDWEDDGLSFPSSTQLVGGWLNQSGARIERIGGAPWLVGEPSTEELRDIEALCRDASRSARVHVGLSASGVAVRMETDLRPGKVATLRSVREARADEGVHPELACDDSGGLHPSVIGRPTYAPLGEGWQVRVRACPVEGSGAWLVEVVAVVARESGSPEVVRAAPRWLGDLRLSRAVSGVLIGSGRLAPGQTLILAATGSHGPVRLTLALEERRASGATRSERIGRLATDALLLAPWRVWIDPPEDLLWDLPRGEDAHLVLLDQAEPSPFVAAYDSVLEPHPGDGHVRQAGGCDACGTPEEMRALRSGVAGLFTDAGRDVRLRARVLERERVLHDVELRALDGRWAVARLGHERMVILDHETEVG